MSKVDRVEKVYLSELDRIDEGLDLLKESCSSIKVLVRLIQKATKNSYAVIARVVQITVIFKLSMLLAKYYRKKEWD